MHIFINAYTFEVPLRNSHTQQLLSFIFRATIWQIDVSWRHLLYSFDVEAATQKSRHSFCNAHAQYPKCKNTSLACLSTLPPLTLCEKTQTDCESEPLSLCVCVCVRLLPVPKSTLINYSVAIALRWCAAWWAKRETFSRTTCKRARRDRHLATKHNGILRRNAGGGINHCLLWEAIKIGIEYITLQCAPKALYHLSCFGAPRTGCKTSGFRLYIPPFWN